MKATLYVSPSSADADIGLLFGRRGFFEAGATVTAALWLAPAVRAIPMLVVGWLGVRSFLKRAIK